MSERLENPVQVYFTPNELNVLSTISLRRKVSVGTLVREIVAEWLKQSQS